MNQISDAELHRYQEMERQVKWVLSQRADDVCWRDVYTNLAKCVHSGYVPQLICDRAQHLRNCEVFIDSLRTGRYEPVYVENRQEVKCLKEGIDFALKYLRMEDQPDDLPVTPKVHAMNLLTSMILDEPNRVSEVKRLETLIAACVMSNGLSYQQGNKWELHVGDDKMEIAPTCKISSHRNVATAATVLTVERP